MGGSVGKSLVSLATAGTYDLEKNRFQTPFSKGNTQSPGKAIKGLLGTTVGGYLNEALTGGSAGIIDVEKGRINVPFSGAQGRRATGATINALSLGLAKNDAKTIENSKTVRTAAPIVGGLGAVATGYGAAGAFGASGSASALAGATAGGAVQKVDKPLAPYTEPTNPTEESEIELAAKRAANAVQTADAVSRRARAAKRQSSVLSSYQANQQTNAVTLQPASPRKSVLG